MIVERFLGVAQIEIQSADENGWKRPALRLAVMLAEGIANFGVLANSVSEMSSIELRTNSTQFNSILDDKRKIKRMARNMGAGTLQELCKVTSMGDLDEMIIDIEESFKSMQSSRRSGGSSGRSVADRQTPIMLEREKRVEEANISKADIQKLDEITRDKATSIIEISDVNLLVLCMGSTLTSMQKGRRDLKGVSMSRQLLGYLTKAWEALCPTDSMRAFLEAALARLLTLKMWPNDNLLLEEFGPLAVKDAYSTYGGTNR